MRKPPQTEVKEVVPAADKLITQERKYELITPLFGGGVKAGENDPITVINGKSIRGQLRFWWRAMRGGKFGNDVRAMRNQERLIWGAASTDEEKLPSMVQIVVKSMSCDFNQAVAFGNIEGRFGNGLKYAAFPLQPNNDKVQPGITFTLLTQLRYDQARCGKLSFEDLITEVNAAFWAWETFGGIGARTRRGFGALRLVNWQQNSHQKPLFWNIARNVANPTQAAFDLLYDGYDEFYIDGISPTGVARLPSDFSRVVLCRSNNANDAWQYLINGLKDFRQSYRPRRGTRPVPAGRTVPPGRSRWPEPEAVRDITGQRLAPNLRSATDRGHPLIPQHAGRLFPRGQFGLPIVFEFHRDDRHNTATNRDPRKTTLQLKPTNQNDPVQRWASPLILRPLAIGPNVFVGMAIYLENSKPTFPAALYEANGRTLIRAGLSIDISPAQKANITGLPDAPPITTRTENGVSYIDILLDFLDTL